MRCTYTDMTKARALATLLTGERPAAVARKLLVPEGTVRSWKHRLKNDEIATLKKGTGGAFGRLVMDHLEASLMNLIVQAEHLANPATLQGMRAGELGVFFSTLFDRTLRILELLPALRGDRGEGGR